MVARNVLARIGIHIPMAMEKIGSWKIGGSAGRERILSQAGTGGERGRPLPIRIGASLAQKIPGLTAEVGKAISRGNPTALPSRAGLLWKRYRGSTPRTTTAAAPACR